MTKLWRVEGDRLVGVAATGLKKESTIEDWLASDPTILGLDLLIIGRQVRTDFGGQIDLLGIDRNGDLTIIECKRNQTPRDVVAQILDYASWVKPLNTKQVHEIAASYLRHSLESAFKERFSDSIPEVLNTSHNMVIVATEFDSSSKRIVEYLAEQHGVSINTAFFSYFKDGATEYLAADWLMDQEQVIERSQARTQSPWTGFYYVNAGQGPHRDWEDMRKYGFIAAGFGRRFSGQLNQLSVEAPIFVYQRQAGYIGYGIVTSPAVMAKDYKTYDGKAFSEINLQQPNILHDPEDPEIAEYVVGVNWKKTLPISQALRQDGLFSNQNVVCKLRHPATLSFLVEKFGAEIPSQKGA